MASRSAISSMAKLPKTLSSLDISHARISDVIPDWFWNLPTEFVYLNFSNNQLFSVSSVSGVIVDLSSNQFTGPLPHVIPLLQYLFLSKNLFWDPFLICDSLNHLAFVSIFDIESNLLSDEIPDCWENLRSLEVLNLGNNNLIGKIPRSMGSLHGIKSLSLHNNSLFGEVPSTLQYLSNMSVLDLSENQFTGNITAWIGNKLSSLVVLNLHSNNFQGYIPDQICAFNSLQVLDLGYNNILGAIPKCFSNLSAMATKTHQYMGVLQLEYVNQFVYSTTLVMKGREDEYSTTLGLVTTIDLSVNSLTGEIPKELGNLIGL
ncbi:hypothetical protein DITRI_Ditri06bG0145600 [Diplodiscus trichospermus]